MVVRLYTFYFNKYELLTGENMYLNVIRTKMLNYFKIIKTILREHGLGHLHVSCRCVLSEYFKRKCGIPISWTIDLRNKKELFKFCKIEFEKYVNENGVLLHIDNFYECKYKKQEMLKR